MPSYGFDIENYINVEERLAALHEEHPGTSILTEVTMSSPDLGRVIVKATICLPGEHNQTVTGHAEGSTADGDKWLEKTETVAIGRACANLSMPRFRNSPRMSAEENAAWQARQAARTGSMPSAAPRPSAAPGNAPTEAQLRFLGSVCREAGIPVPDTAIMDRRQVSLLIDEIKAGNHPDQRAAVGTADARAIFDADPVDEIPF